MSHAPTGRKRRTTEWRLWHDCRLPAAKIAVEDSGDLVVLWAPRAGGPVYDIAMSRRTARVLARRINQVLDGSSE